MNSTPSPGTSGGPQFTLTVSPPAPAEPPRRPSKTNKALWLVGIGLLANAAVMLFGRGQGSDIILDRSAFGQVTSAAQSSQLLGARGIYMMPAQLGPNAYGLYLMDVDSGTICVYKTTPETNHFRLMAARTYKYDRFMEDFNNEPLHPSEVKKIVESQQQRQGLQEKESVPTVEQNPRPDENMPEPASKGAGGMAPKLPMPTPSPAKSDVPMPLITVTPAGDLPKPIVPDPPKGDGPVITITPAGDTPADNGR
jgi:hypothetical protein